MLIVALLIWGCRFNQVHQSASELQVYVAHPRQLGLAGEGIEVGMEQASSRESLSLPLPLPNE